MSVVFVALVAALGVVATAFVNLVGPGLLPQLKWSRRTTKVAFWASLGVSAVAVGLLAGLGGSSEQASTAVSSGVSGAPSQSSGMPSPASGSPTTDGSGAPESTAVSPKATHITTDSPSAPSGPTVASESTPAELTSKQACRIVQDAAAAEEAALRALSRSVRADPDNSVLLGPGGSYPNAYQSAVQRVDAANEAITQLLRAGGTLPDLGPDVSYQRDTDRLKNQDLPRLNDGIAARTYSDPGTFNAWNELTRYAEHARDTSRTPCG